MGYKAIFHQGIFGMRPIVPSKPPWAKRGAYDELLVLLDASLSILSVCLHSRNDLDFFKFARVRADDRERKFRDGHVPQQLDEKLTMIRTPSREFRNQSSDFRWPRRPSSQEKNNAQRIEHPATLRLGHTGPGQAPD